MAFQKRYLQSSDERNPYIGDSRVSRHSNNPLYERNNPLCYKDPGNNQEYVQDIGPAKNVRPPTSTYQKEGTDKPHSKYQPSQITSRNVFTEDSASLRNKVAVELKQLQGLLTLYVSTCYTLNINSKQTSRARRLLCSYKLCDLLFNPVSLHDTLSITLF